MDDRDTPLDGPRGADLDLLERRLAQGLRDASDDLPPAGFSTADVLVGGRALQRARRRRCGVGAALVASAAAALVVLVPTLDWSALVPRPVPPADVVDGPQQRGAREARERLERLAPQREVLRAAIAARLTDAGVVPLGAWEPIPAGAWQENLWRADLQVRTAAGDDVRLSVGTRAPGAAPEPEEGGPGVTDQWFPDVDCSAAQPFSFQDPALEPEPAELAECSVERLPDGSTLTVVAWPPSPGREDLGPQGRRTVLRPAVGGYVWVEEGPPARVGEQPQGLTAEQQRAVVLDPALQLPSARG